MSEIDMSYVNEQYTHPRVQLTIFDLDSFEPVTVAKEKEFEPVNSFEQAKERLANDSDKLLRVINDGLRAEEMRQMRESADGWRTLDDEGNLNGAFSGTPANMKMVNATVLNLAKTVFEYGKEDSPEWRKKAKEAARDFVKGNETIRNGLKKSAALASGDESEG